MVPVENYTPSPAEIEEREAAGFRLAMTPDGTVVGSEFRRRT